MNVGELPLPELVAFRDCLKRFGELPRSGGRNVPDAHPGMLVIFSINDGLEHTKNFQRYMSEEMKRLLERMFPGSLDQQKYALLRWYRETASGLIGTQYDTTPGLAAAPTGMEWLEVEGMARDPVRPVDPAELRRWERRIKMRLGYLWGTQAWTGDLQEPILPPWKGKYHKKRGEARARLLKVACEQVHGLWLARIDSLISTIETGFGRDA